MKPLLFAALAAFGLYLSCSSGEKIAGSKGGSETTNGVTACVFRGDGTPASGSVVHLRRTDYVSLPAVPFKKTLESADALTDAHGRFLILGIDPGAYCIEVNDTSTAAGRGGAVLFTCTVDSCDTTDLPADSLHPYALVTGTVDSAGAGGGRLYAQIRGLERLAAIGADGSFSLHDLPAGNLDVRIVGDGGGFSAKEILNVKTSPGRTVAVNVSGTSVFSTYVRLNTADAGEATDFPFLIRLDSSDFDFFRAGPGGNDIRFTKTDNTPFPYEIERWDALTEHAEVWVRIDTVYGNGREQFIVMKWGDSSAIGQSNGARVFDTAQGFAGVWHMSENPEAGENAIKDRTASGYNGTANGSMAAGNSVPGTIGAALYLDGDDDYIDVGQLNVSGSYSLSCWIYADDLSSARRFIWKEYYYTLWYDAIGGGIRVEHFVDSLVWRGIYQDNFRLVPLNAKTWYYLAGTFDGDKIRLYVNGELRDSTQTIGNNPHQSREPLSLGGRTGEFFKGIMDEVRIETKARSADWIRLCYRNQKHPD